MKTREHLHFITGRLAEHAVRSIVEKSASQHGFDYSIGVMPITVAALMTGKWLLRHWDVPEQADKIILPGHFIRDLAEIAASTGKQVECGPRDIRDLPLFFGGKQPIAEDYGQNSIEIIAEINHAPQLQRAELMRLVNNLLSEGADVIDLGCTPGHQWTTIGDAVKEITDAGTRVSVDSFDPSEVQLACAAGAELVLSVNSQNREMALDWGTEVVAIPDTPSDEKSLKETTFFLADAGIPTRLDPILEPIGCGFAASLERYAACRRDFPDAQMMMGIGNLTELTDVDSAGINVLLLGICQELRIESVLTTQVINWARSSVKECDLARQLVHHACQHRIPPKNLDSRLVMLRDTRLKEYDFETLESLASSIRDKNIRLSNSGGEIHAVSASVHVHDADPFAVMHQLLLSSVGESIDPSHAFYLGFEMAKALTAQTLSKQYEQDEPLDWGFLTQPESHLRLKRTPASPKK